MWPSTCVGDVAVPQRKFSGNRKIFSASVGAGAGMGIFPRAAYATRMETHAKTAHTVQGTIFKAGLFLTEFTELSELKSWKIFCSSGTDHSPAVARAIR
jgi:hypothetical protein